MSASRLLLQKQDIGRVSDNIPIHAHIPIMEVLDFTHHLYALLVCQIRSNLAYALLVPHDHQKKIVFRIVLQLLNDFARGSEHGNLLKQIVFLCVLLSQITYGIKKIPEVVRSA